MSRYTIAPEVRARLVPDDGQPARVALLGGEDINRPMALGLQTLSGYEAVLSSRTNAFYNAWEERPAHPATGEPGVLAPARPLPDPSGRRCESRGLA